ncbi:DUF3159 domain-containing protein [Pseudonocardia sp. HH130630-07]|uniref:DUF3159 domain-containing protein n=1 Tax=Pseudonocardia sp. HH130630-07 TaxID=1690815 RepID=UPI000814CAC8|nr:DUF3159 domain-containing protein [Pseudonocardia sp. HH130630-07]ANY10472.1 hypothetical protein AFB00_28040 [Pseudonocardia sp. HH130630-07]
MTDLNRERDEGVTPTEHPTATPAAPSATPASAASMLDQMGGPMGFVYSTVPVVVFAAANAFLPLPVTIAVSVGVAVLLTVFRLVRGERFSSAVGGLIAVGVAVGLVAWTGSAKDFFAIGIWAALAGFVVTAVSVLARRPVTGLIWNAVHGNTHDWRADRPSLRAHDIATLAAAAVFGARFVVQYWLYAIDTTGGLAIARVAMGTPLTIVGALVVVWAFRRTSKRLLPRS